MTSTLLQMTLMMACGLGWRLLATGGLDAQPTRAVLTSVVYYVFLPALVLEVLWSTDIGAQTAYFSALGIASILLCLAMMWALATACGVGRRRLGAMLLAVFPNVTYLGLPVLEQTFGGWARAVAIQIDLFAATPVLFTVGLLAARHYGDDGGARRQPMLANLNAPPFWAAGAAMVLNACGVEAPDWLAGALRKLAAAVVPLMLFAIGLALNFRALSLRSLPDVVPVVVVKMVAMPAVALLIAGRLGLSADQQAAAVLDLAMPSMLMGIVLCDRYRLDSDFYAMAVTVTTLSSLVTLPVWYGVANCWLMRPAAAVTAHQCPAL